MKQFFAFIAVPSDMNAKDRARTSQYEQLRLECLRDGKLYEDPDFPANNSSLTNKNQLNVKIEWRRPTVSRTL